MKLMWMMRQRISTTSISADIRPSSDGWMYLKAVDNGSATTVMTLKPGAVIMDGSLEAGDIDAESIAATDVTADTLSADTVAGGTSVTAPTVIATTAVQAHNVAFAWALVTHSGGSYTLAANTYHGFTGTPSRSSAGVVTLTLASALPLNSGGTGLCVVTGTLYNNAGFFHGQIAGVTTTQITVYLSDTSNTPADSSFQVVVYAKRS